MTATIAEEKKDYLSLDFLTNFAAEQLKEENVSKEIVTAFEAADGNNCAVYMLDKELGERKFL